MEALGLERKGGRGNGSHLYPKGIHRDGGEEQLLIKSNRVYSVKGTAGEVLEGYSLKRANGERERSQWTHHEEAVRG